MILGADCSKLCLVLRISFPDFAGLVRLLLELLAIVPIAFELGDFRSYIIEKYRSVRIVIARNEAISVSIFYIAFTFLRSELYCIIGDFTGKFIRQTFYINL
jgi:hypothetical protein